MKELRRYVAPYTQKTRHRHKCRACGKLLQDGEDTLFVQVQMEGRAWQYGYVPARPRWHFWHPECKRAAHQES